MKILHTSDWHLGRSLYDRKRYDEFDKFLNWLIKFIADEQIDILLVSGDIFDSTTPSNKAQELYYKFLSKIQGSGCRHVVIIGGNHDSPTLLDAPKNLLGALNIHVIGAKTENLVDEVLVLKNSYGNPEAIVCAVPFLRDRDIRTVEANESPDDKTQKLLYGIEHHYEDIAGIAKKLQVKNDPVPVIGMGHLFTKDAQTKEGDGVRELYIGSLAHIDGKAVSDGFDYMALGHLHLAQQAGNSETVRYSGSPIPMGFAEAGQTKKVIVIKFNSLIPTISEHPVPCFQDLISFSGDIETISSAVKKLKSEKSKAWLEIEITSATSATNITSHFDELIKDSDLEILRIRNKNIVDRVLSGANETETLASLDDSEVFERCLDAFEINEPEERRIMTETYKEAVDSMVNEDSNAI